MVRLAGWSSDKGLFLSPQEVLTICICSPHAGRCGSNQRWRQFILLMSFFIVNRPERRWPTWPTYLTYLISFWFLVFFLHNKTAVYDTVQICKNQVVRFLCINFLFLPILYGRDSTTRLQHTAFCIVFCCFFHEYHKHPHDHRKHWKHQKQHFLYDLILQHENMKTWKHTHNRICSWFCKKLRPWRGQYTLFSHSKEFGNMYPGQGNN